MAIHDLVGDFSPHDLKKTLEEFPLHGRKKTMNVIKLKESGTLDLLKFTHSKVRLVYFQLWNFRCEILVQ